MATSIDQQFVEFIVKSLVNNPDAVSIERRIDEKGVLLELTVDAEDLGRVIGKRGATAQSLRTLLRALGTKNEARYNLKIIDVGGPRPPRDDNQAASSEPAEEPAKPKAPVAKAKAADEPEEKAEEPTAQRPADDLDDIQDDEDKADTKDSSSDLATRTRAELADLDDLDV